MAYKSGNPALNKNTFNNLAAGVSSKTMSLCGVAVKCLALLVLCVSAGAVGWQMISRDPDKAVLILIVATLAALPVAIVTVFKKTVSPFTAPLYAVLEGFILGVISQMYNAQFDGIVVQAILLTVGIFLAMLLIYLTGIIKVTQNLRLGIAAATGGVFLFYLATLILGLFGVDMPLVNSASPWGIIFSVVVIAIASLNLVVDFDFVEQGVEQKAPKYMEWYASFGLFVTLVWLYIEILRLLGKLKSN